MAMSFKLFIILLLLAVIAIVQAKPLDESKSVEPGGETGEMMDTAESQNPFLPRFAMRKLKERREKARAQRRNQASQGQKRNYNQGYQVGWRQPGVPCRHYKK